MTTIAERDLKLERNQRLAETDWIGNADAVAATPSRRVAELRAMRQALRDLPPTVADPVAFMDAGPWPVLDLTSDTIPLETVRHFAHECLTMQTSRIEERYFTATMLRSMVYMQKRAEALNFDGGGSGPWPMIDADIGTSSGATRAEVVATVLERSDAGTAAAAALEAPRRVAMDALDAATTRAEIVAALDVFDTAVVAAGLTPAPL